MPEEPVTTIEAHRTTILMVDGSERVLLRVFCPSTSRSVPAETCASCGRCESMDLAPDRSALTVGCRPEQAADALPRRKGPDLGELAARTPVGEIAARRITATRPDVPMDRLALVLAGRGGAAVPVINDDGLLLGILSARDALRALSGKKSRRARRVAASFMTAPVHTVSEEARVSHAVALMADEHVRQVPVLGEGGDLVGMVTDRSVLTWMARGFGYGPEEG